MEKLSPLLALYTVADWREADELARRLLEFGGLGHTFGIHCKDETVIEKFGLSQPASRIVVNSGTTFGGIGATTGIQPSLTLGCGARGNNITSDNIGPQHLMNIKRVAFGIREVPDPGAATQDSSRKTADAPAERVPAGAAAGVPAGIKKEDIMEIIREVLKEMNAEKISV